MDLTRGDSRTHNDPIVIVFAADDNYVIPLAAAVRSVLDNGSSARELCVVVIADGITREHRDRLLDSWDLGPGQSVSFERAPVAKLEGLPTWEPFGRAAYYRLLIPEILPQETRRAIYLDSDVIVNADLTELFERDLEGHPLGAVRDGAVQMVCAGLARFRELGFAPDAPYLNSGVLLMDLDHWRAEDLGSRVLDFLAENREWIQWPDQDALNAVFAGRWLELGERWNTFSGLWPPRGSPRGVTLPPPIIHFLMAPKPWSGVGRNAERKRFFEYLDRTAWARWRPKTSVPMRPFPLAVGTFPTRENTHPRT